MYPSLFKCTCDLVPAEWANQFISLGVCQKADCSVLLQNIYMSSDEKKII